jgi:hypothetical protein
MAWTRIQLGSRQDAAIEPLLARCDGVDGARAASGSMKGRAKMVVVRATEGEAMGRAAAVWHHRRWMKVMEVPHAPS